MTGIKRIQAKIDYTVYCVCDTCGEDIGSSGYLIQDKMELKPRRILRCDVCYKNEFSRSEDFVAVMRWIRDSELE